MQHISKLASSRLDLLRGTAALCVFFGHSRALFLGEFEQAHSDATLVRGFYFLTGLGHQAVIVFFVLSGFLVTRSILGAVRQDRWSWTEYGLSRVTRLMIVLIPAIALGSALDRAGVALFGLRNAYAGNDYVHIFRYAVTDCWGPLVAFGNLLFLQGIAVPTFGSNGPLWSLSYEFWYYALFPLLLFGTSRATRLVYKVICLCLAIFLGYCVGRPILSAFPIWLLGAALAWLKPLPESYSRTTIAAGAVAFLGAIGLSRAHASLPDLAIDLIVGASFGLLIAGILAERLESPAPWYEPAARGLAGMSYTLYLVHLPLLVFLNAWLVSDGSRGPLTWLRLCFLAGVCVLVFGYAWTVSALTERRTATARNYVRDRLRRMSAEVVAS